MQGHVSSFTIHDYCRTKKRGKGWVFAQRQQQLRRQQQHYNLMVLQPGMTWKPQQWLFLLQSVTQKTILKQHENSISRLHLMEWLSIHLIEPSKKKRRSEKRNVASWGNRRDTLLGFWTVILFSFLISVSNIKFVWVKWIAF